MSENTKVYIAFVESLKQICAEEGIPVQVTENKGWVNFESTVNKHKFYVPKSATVMGLCETTLPVSNRNGARPLAKPNGKIMCKFQADLDLIADTILPLLASSEDSLPANRPPTRKSAE